MTIPHILFLAPENFSDIQKSVLSEALSEELHNQIQSSMVVKTLKPADDIYLKLSQIVYDIEEKKYQYHERSFDAYLNA